MSTISINPALEYKVVRLDADIDERILAEGLNLRGQEGWQLASTYHLHHLNAVFYIFSRELGTSTT
jgi:hypothetical protein